jgi:Txe/YoeB family toxin of Txe-Axe toxin-antitoxin module
MHLQQLRKARVNDFVIAFYENPAHPSISLERLNARDDNVWSGRISQDLRAISL